MNKISHLVQTAVRNYQAGEMGQAESLCRQILSLDPGEINALHILGLIALQAGKPDQAIKLIGKAISRDQAVPIFHLSLGNALQVNGAPDSAIKAYQTALKLDPRNPVTHNNLANVYTQLRQVELARKHFQRALTLQPDYASALLGLGNILNIQGQQDEAVKYYQQALQLQPAYAEAHCYLGVILKNKGRRQEAIRHLEQALAQRPQYTDALINLGNALQDDRQFDAAIEKFRQYLAIRPDDAGCHYNLGNSYYQKGEIAEAIRQFEHSVALKPDFYHAHSNLGNALYMAGQNDRALKHLEHAIELAPDYAEAHNNMGCLLKDNGYLQKAVSHFKQALVYRPDFTEAYSNTGVALHALGQLDEALSYYEKTLQLQPDKADTFSNLLLALNYSTDYDAGAIFARHRQYAEHFESPVIINRQPHSNILEPGKRLRVGYVSPDFRDHAVAFFIEPVLAHHAHDQFEIYCYYNNVKTDIVTQRLQGFSNHWRNIVAMPDDEVVRLIQEDQIDILVDLAGHTAMNRLQVFAHKAAPVQVTWLGYLNTTGLKSMDYRITDSHANPPGKTGQYNTEALIRMPDSQWCYQPPPGAPPVDEPLTRQTEQITLGSFHTLAKVTPLVTRLWSKILHAVPNARLLMVARGLEQREVQKEILSRFASHGLETTRIHFLGSQSFANYLQLHQQVDINLDTSPYTGGTTTCHSLWMGVPVITLAGETATSRGGASILNALKLSSLVADTEEEYVNIARHLANDQEELYNIKRGLRALMSSSPLINGEQFTSALEQIYRKIWINWCQGNTPPNSSNASTSDEGRI